jgi:flagellar biosynthesis/type III secretory pathway protein FliH
MSSRSIVLNSGMTGLVFPGTPSSPPPFKGPDLDKIRKEAAAEALVGCRARIEKQQIEQADRCRRCGSQFDDFIERMKLEIADEVIGLAVRLAEILLRHELPDRQMLCRIIRETLEPVSDLQGAKVRMNPDDAENVRRLRDEAATPMIVSDRIEIVPDSSLSVGDLLIESRNGLFDARLNQRLSLLDERLRERRRSNHANGR